MTVRIVTSAFSPWHELEEHEGETGRPGAKTGAAAVFVGTMRDFNEDEDVRRMFLEHYPGMTDRQLEALRDRALAAHGLDAALIVHRVGWIEPGETIVLVAAWAARRAAAFAACREMLEALKSRAPFWKKEELAGGVTRWVTGNTPAGEAAGRAPESAG